MTYLTDNQKRTLGALCSADYKFGDYDTITPTGRLYSTCYFCIHYAVDISNKPCNGCGGADLNNFDPDYLHVYNVEFKICKVERDVDD